ncbi:hypothetical protein GE115_10285 [Agromyces sp. CFH 90414]|uniref:Uncharacterized protein n=1 Tax=Agromyces agglutinans TaxID=2662258 RepID=A0A6I2F6B5_9MICO|nr:hypothetical protein [Agromyces agglutinans]MRG60252.1 hypothetical protein [Agromyces agglutinans]
MTTHHSALSRRTLLQAGGAGALAALVASAGADRAYGAEPSVTVTDLGPGAVQFGSKSAYQFGDTLYIGSRNLEPMYVIAYHVPTATVTGYTTIANGRSTQAICADPTGRYLYIGTENEVNTATLFRWDLQQAEAEAEPLGRAGDVRVWALDVAPDGVVFFGGREPGGNLWSYDPAVGEVVPLGIAEPTATGARAIVATETTVYFGAGNTLGGGTSSKAVLSAYDRASGTFTSILPPELADDDTVRELRLAGDRLVVTTANSTGSSIAVLDLANPADYRVAVHDGITTKATLVHERDVYFLAKAGDLRVCATDTMQISPVSVPGLDIGEVWGLGWVGDQLHAVSAYGFVAHIDVASGAFETTGLIDAGAPPEAQLAMSVTAGGGSAYVAASGILGRHDLATGATANIIAPGESKDAVWAAGRLWMAQYSGHGLWAYDPVTHTPGQAAPLPPSYNRPQSITWDEVNCLVVIVALSDAEGGSCLGIHDPATGSTEVVELPLGPGQSVSYVLAHEGVVYLGGGTGGATSPAGEIVAFDPVTRSVLWRLDPADTKQVTGLAVARRFLYVALHGGGFRVVDRAKRRIVHSERVAFAPKAWGLVTSRNRVFAVTAQELRRIDTTTYRSTIVVPALDGAWYGGGIDISADEDGRMYTMRDRNLVQIDVR